MTQVAMKEVAEVTAGEAQGAEPPPAPEAIQTPWEKLRAPFPAERIGQVPKGGAMLSFVGHADVTDRLLEVDPEWNWEPLAFTDLGLPRFVLNDQDKPVGLWIKLTVRLQEGGALSRGITVTRLGYGSVTTAAYDPEKQLIGDAIRNAAMRFGVALDLWRKEETAPAAEAATASPRPSSGASGASKVPCPTCAMAGYKNAKSYPAVFWSDRLDCDGVDAEGDAQHHKRPPTERAALSGVGAAVVAAADQVPLEAYDDGIPF